MSHRPLIIVKNSDNFGRATVIPINPTTSMAPRRRSKRTKRRTRKRAGPTGGHRFVKGKISLRVAGFKGVQKLGAAQLCRFVPLSKLKTAAKKILKTFKVGKKAGRRRKGRKSRRRRRKARK